MDNTYRGMKAINKSLQKKLEFERNYQEGLERLLEDLEDQISQERWINKLIRKRIEFIDRRCTNILKQVKLKHKKIQQLEERLAVANEINNKIVKANGLFKRDINKQIREIKRLNGLVSYYSFHKKEFSFRDKQNIELLLNKISLSVKKLLLMRNQKVRRVNLICELRKELGEYEDFFYKNNFKVEEDVRKLLIKIDCFFTQWMNYYQGYKWDSKEISVEDVRITEIYIKELVYISVYKRFEKLQEEILPIEKLFETMKENRRIPSNYIFGKFHNEMKLLAKQKYINFDKFITTRIFPGKIYGNLKSFNTIKYDFDLMKTYGMFHILYVYGSYKNNIVKIGVTKESLLRRYIEARERYNFKFDTNDFGEIKIIESYNALNLETYLKRKFKQQRHPLFDSTEWFFLTETEFYYFSKEQYKLDADFMSIVNYSLEI
ncbi:GIY-YIG nuclease family protein [Priestia sp. TGN 0903]|uniref:GIY-YIG nuclease family protein n=1 Tax=Priestia sp. TGN 0903 TaxID=3420730 RepID=UPI003D7888E9